jgi:hypothetical protein
MRRLDTLLGVGIGLVIGLGLAWAGISFYHGHQSAPADPLDQKQAIDSLMREIVELRQELTRMKRIRAEAQPAPVEANAKHAEAAAGELTAPRGRITKIDPADSTVVEVSLGKDAGIAKYNNLEILRGTSSAEHIGTLRVFEVYAERAVCRLVSTNPLKKREPRIGDEVSAAR